VLSDLMILLTGRRRVIQFLDSYRWEGVMVDRFTPPPTQVSAAPLRPSHARLSRSRVPPGSPRNAPWSPANVLQPQPVSSSPLRSSRCASAPGFVAPFPRKRWQVPEDSPA